MRFPATEGKCFLEPLYLEFFFADLVHSWTQYCHWIPFFLNSDLLQSGLQHKHILSAGNRLTAFVLYEHLFSFVFKCITLLCAASMFQFINNNELPSEARCLLITELGCCCTGCLHHSPLFMCWLRCKHVSQYHQCPSTHTHIDAYTDPDIAVLTSKALRWPHASRNAPSHTSSCRERQQREERYGS